MAFVFGEGAVASFSLSFPRSTVSHRRCQTVGAVSHQSSTCLELLMLDSPTVHVSLLSQNSLNSKQDRRSGGARFGQIAVLSGRLVPARAPTQKRIKCSVRVRVAVPRQQTLGASDRQLSWLGSDWLNRLRSVVDSALNSEDPKTDGEITCDPRGPSRGTRFKNGPHNKYANNKTQ
ncbi:hypothetical protein PanWU01x14_349300 [Parasponia andersonii]|uniref:Uncharacterized protein n=1 Tax=Parasponia andersonii TaxID=3476 RepID=A0A2P5ABB2_PARAD|nr:hypothetical protein PanWU01x14_349300 [Parasponia andersonii]